MPEGFDGVREVAAEVNAKRGSGGNTLFLRFKDGESKTVRFLEQDNDVHWCWVHESVPAGARTYGRDYPCLRQKKGSTDPCPGCEAGLDRKFKGYINLIWRDAPVLRRDKEGKIVTNQAGEWQYTGETSDQIYVWEGGIKLFEVLDEKNKRYRGLCSRDFDVRRAGVNFPTYHVDPHDPDGGPQPMSEADTKLAEGKPDLNTYTTPNTYDETKRLLNGESWSDVKGKNSGGPARQGGVESGDAARRTNVFMNVGDDE